MPAPALIVEDGTGKPDSNSYVSLAEAKTYLAGRLYVDAWDNFDDTDQTKALITAARAIDMGFEFYGGRSSTTQAMAFPRAYIENVDLYSPGFYPATILNGLVELGATGYLGTYWPSNVVPPPIKAAQIEMARQLSEIDRTAEDPSKGISSLNIPGALSITFTPADRRDLFDDTVKMLLGPFGRFRGAGGTIKRVVRM